MRAQKPLPGCPTKTTGVPNKDLGPQAARLPHQGGQTSRKPAPLDPMIPPPQHTGVPNKNYRGPQQVLPGCPTKTTGVPNKRHFLKLLQNGGFCVAFRGSFVFVYLVVLCC